MQVSLIAFTCQIYFNISIHVGIKSPLKTQFNTQLKIQLKLDFIMYKEPENLNYKEN